MSDELTVEQLASELSGDSDNEQPETDSQSAEVEQQTAEPQDEAQEQSDAEAEPEQPETDSAPLVELELDGEKVQLTVDEVKKGYLRQQDYTQKAQTLARERQEIQTRIQQDFQSMQAMAGEIGQLTSIDGRIAQYDQATLQQLRESDPPAYAFHLAELNNLRAMRGDLVAKLQGKHQHMQQQQAQQRAEKAGEALEYLKTVIPNFSQDTVKSLEQRLLKNGYTLDELAQKTD